MPTSFATGNSAIDSDHSELQRLNSTDKAVLDALGNVKGELWDKYGYPNHEAVWEIAEFTGLDEVHIYYSLKFLKSNGLISRSGVDKQAVEKFEKTPVVRGMTVITLHDLLREAAGLPPEDQIIDLPGPTTPIDRIADRAYEGYQAARGDRPELSGSDLMVAIEPLCHGLIAVGKSVDELANRLRATDLFKAQLAVMRQPSGTTFKDEAEEHLRWFKEFLTPEKILSRELADRVAAAFMRQMMYLNQRYQVGLAMERREKDTNTATADLSLADEIFSIPETYPAWVWDGTGYGDFAREATRGNFIPPEFPIEALKTFVGAAAGHLMGVEGDDNEARFYTVLIGLPQKGKSTSINNAQKVLPASLAYTGIWQWEEIGTLVGGFGSQVGLIKKAKVHRQILQLSDEFSTLADKFKITGSGLSFQSLINELYEKTLPPSNYTKDSVTAIEKPLHFSLLGATTPDKWADTFGGAGTEGSGFIQRLNIVGSDEERTVAQLPKINFELFSSLVNKIKALRENSYTMPLNEEAKRLLQDWYRWLQTRTEADTGRLNTLAIRNAAHLGWLLDVGRGGRTGPEEVIRRVIVLSNYQLKMRQKYQPIQGDTPWAMMENKIVLVVKQTREIARRDLYRKVHGARYGLKVFNSALTMLSGEGLIKLKEQKGARRPTQMILWDDGRDE